LQFDQLVLPSASKTLKKLSLFVSDQFFQFSWPFNCEYYVCDEWLVIWSWSNDNYGFIQLDSR